MKRLQTLLLALVAVSALGVVMAASASAETTLAAEWLAAGAKITAAQASTTTGELLVEDNKAFGTKGSFTCSFILDGTVGPGGAGSITAVLTLAGASLETLVVGKSLLCEADEGSACAKATEASPIEVWPTATLPWKTLAFLTEAGLFRDGVFGAGYEVLCLVLGVNLTDECTTAAASFELVNGTSDVQIPNGTTQSPNANCTVGGAGAGVNQAVGVANVELVSKATLAVSE